MNTGTVDSVKVGQKLHTSEKPRSQHLEKMDLGERSRFHGNCFAKYRVVGLDNNAPQDGLGAKLHRLLELGEVHSLKNGDKSEMSWLKFFFQKPFRAIL